MAVDLDALSDSLRVLGYQAFGTWAVDDQFDSYWINKDGDEAATIFDMGLLSLLARRLTAQPAVPVDAIARLVRNEQLWQARKGPEPPEGWDALYRRLNNAMNAIQPTDCETVRAWLETIKGVGE